MKKNIIKKFTFSTEEREKLKDLDAGIIISRAQIDGMQIYKNAILSATYKRLGIDKDAPKGFTKNIQYNLGENRIEYSETPINKDLLVKK